LAKDRIATLANKRQLHALAAGEQWAGPAADECNCKLLFAGTRHLCTACRRCGL